MASVLTRGGCGGSILLSSAFRLRGSFPECSSGLFPARLRHTCRFPNPLPTLHLRRVVHHFLSCAPHSKEDGAGVVMEDEAPPRPPPASPADSVKEAADGLDIRVGRVLRAWRHPEADSLYVEEVDLGEPEPRTICSGLVNYVPLEHLQGIQVVVLANLKPRNMRGVKSNGMLMAASDTAHENVELLMPPEGSLPGERIWFGSEEEKDSQLDAATPNQVQKKKIWESVQPHLKTTDSCVAVLGVRPMRTSAGVVVCKTLSNANIS